MFAVEVSDAITGGASWASVLINGGVLGWLLFKGLPDKDKQIAEVAGKHEAIIKGLAEAQIVMDKERRADHKEIVAMVIGHCQAESAQIASMMSRSLSEISGAVIGLKRAIEENGHPKPKHDRIETS